MSVCALAIVQMDAAMAAKTAAAIAKEVKEAEEEAAAVKAAAAKGLRRLTVRLEEPRSEASERAMAKKNELAALGVSIAELRMSKDGFGLGAHETAEAFPVQQRSRVAAGSAVASIRTATVDVPPCATGVARVDEIQAMVMEAREASYRAIEVARELVLRAIARVDQVIQSSTSVEEVREAENERSDAIALLRKLDADKAVLASGVGGACCAAGCR